MKEARYEVVKTLIRGKQSVRKVKTGERVRIIRHKKPVGYVLMDLKTGKKKVVTDLEAVVMVIQYGATNVMVTATQKRDGRISPYIRSSKGLNLQDKEMVSDPVEYVEENPGVEISAQMLEIIERYREMDRRSGNSGDERKYGEDLLLKSALELMHERRVEQEV